MKKLILFILLVLPMAMASLAQPGFAVRGGCSTTMGYLGIERFFGDNVGVQMGWALTRVKENHDEKAHNFGLGASYYFDDLYESGFYLFGGAMVNGGYEYLVGSGQTTTNWFSTYSAGGGYHLVWDFFDIKIGAGYQFSQIRSFYAIDLTLGIFF